MDTSIFGLSLSLSTAAKAASKMGQSPLLFCWLAYCDDVTSRDIIIILIKAVNHHEQLFLFNFWWLWNLNFARVRGRNHKLGRPSKLYKPRSSYRNKAKNLRSHATVNMLPADWQAGSDRTDLDTMRWSKAIGWVRTSTHRLSVAGRDRWAYSGKRKGSTTATQKNVSGLCSGNITDC